MWYRLCDTIKLQINKYKKRRENEMKITRDTSCYNERRYGKPWIAKIYLEGNELKFQFGTWVGDPGDEGVLILENIEPGDFFARGQKDFRKPANSKPDYYRFISENDPGSSVTKPEIYKTLSDKKKGEL
jgi:hypothetical protein